MSSVYVVCWIFFQTFQTYFLHTGKQCGPWLFAKMTFKSQSRWQSRQQLNCCDWQLNCCDWQLKGKSGPQKVLYPNKNTSIIQKNYLLRSFFYITYTFLFDYNMVVKLTQLLFWTNSADEKLIFFLFFSGNTFDISCKLSICMKCKNVFQLHTRIQKLC